MAVNMSDVVIDLKGQRELTEREKIAMRFPRKHADIIVSGNFHG